MSKYMIAVVQLDTQNNKQENLKAIEQYIDQAVIRGAKLIAFPEVMNILSEDAIHAETIPGPTIKALQRKAQQHKVWIHCGSISEYNPNGARTYNTTILLDNSGEIVAKYRKLHNFDVILPDGTVCCESNRKEPGEGIVVVDTPFGKLGFAICYDIRFPELFRLMAMEGAELIFTPANFTMPTGKDHWEPLLRARAIENGCYIVAPGQIGQKEQFVAYGHSMVVDPWGTVIAKAPEKPGIILAEIDLEYGKVVRKKIGMLENRRSDVYRVEKK